MMIRINKPSVILPPPWQQGCLRIPATVSRNFVVLNTHARSTTISMARQLRHPTLPIILTTKKIKGRTANAASDLASAAAADLDMDEKKIKKFRAYGDPCFDLFFNVVPRDSSYIRIDEDWVELEKDYNTTMFNYLRQQLPLAWSHDPLTTLKLIFNLCICDIDGSKYYEEAFVFAAVWLHHNHPKTLLHNFDSLSDSFDPLFLTIDILYGLLVPPQYQLDHTVEELVQCENPNFHADRYACDPDYRLLHDRFVDAFEERLKSDVEKVKQKKVELKPCDYDDDVEDDTDYDAVRRSLDAHAYDDIQVSHAIGCLLTKNTLEAHMRRSIWLEESIASRFAPKWEQLKMEVLAPLKNYSNRQSRFDLGRPTMVKRYLEEVKAGTGIIKPYGLPPDDILNYLEDGYYGEAAEVQWNAMVQNLKEGGKFKNCWAVCDSLSKRSLQFGLLVYELCAEPWNGKVMTFGLRDDSCGSRLFPQLHSIQGLDDNVKSKFSFLSSMRRIEPFSHTCFDLKMVFDAILEVAANENLKPEQMIKRLFLFTECKVYDWEGYETLYEAVRIMFEENGYAVPHIVFWSFRWGQNSQAFDFPHGGVTVLQGYSEYLVKHFLDNGGDIRPHHLMELAIGQKEYRNLTTVVD